MLKLVKFEILEKTKQVLINALIFLFETVNSISVLTFYSIDVDDYGGIWKIKH